MRIDLNWIPPEGLILEEEIRPGDLELETETVNFSGPVRVKAEISKVSDVIIVDLALKAAPKFNCSRCLEDFEVALERKFKLDYSVNKSALVINLNPEIREEVILGYPLKPLCRLDCKGLCSKCGENLNAGSCKCKGGRSAVT